MDPVTRCADSTSGTTQMNFGIAAARPMPVRRGVIAGIRWIRAHRSSSFAGPSLHVHQEQLHLSYDGFNHAAVHKPVRRCPAPAGYPVSPAWGWFP